MTATARPNQRTNSCFSPAMLWVFHVILPRNDVIARRLPPRPGGSHEVVASIPQRDGSQLESGQLATSMLRDYTSISLQFASR
jgi:hypothetical protein